MAQAPQHVPRYVPARTNDGWAIVGLVVALAATCIISVAIIHQRTYRHPTDPTWHAAGSTGNPTNGTAH